MPRFTVRLRIQADIDVIVNAVGPREAENFAKFNLANLSRRTADDVPLAELADVGTLHVWPDHLRAEELELVDVEELR